MIPSLSIFLLLVLAPFEPRFTLPFGNFELSLLEAVAAVCFLGLALGSRRRRWDGLLTMPLLALVLLFLASVVSASLTTTDPGRGLRFALRLGAMAALAVVTSRLTDREAEWGFRALTVSGGCAALLALAEGLGARSLDVFFAVFREIPFNVAGVRRASAGSEYPNLAAAMILYALLAGVTLLRFNPRLRGGFVLILTAGLACTYSRGAWLAGLSALAALVFLQRRKGERGPGLFQPVIIYLGVLGLFLTNNEISQIRLGSENGNDFYSATYQAPRQFAVDPGGRVTVPLTLRNVGQRPWRVADRFHLSYHLFETPSKPLIDGPRTELPHDVLPGDEARVEVILTAPKAPGEYLVMWDMVHEHTTWFSGQGVTPLVTQLFVGAGPDHGSSAAEILAMRAFAEPLAWRPSRLELWKIALRMWQENPLFGAGPDSFRWTYGTWAGKPVFDTRVFSNNTYLEFAATLGSLGLLAFVTALGFALRNGVRAGPQSDTSMIAFSIVVAMSVHGLADYLLAFTGHYLVFGFVLGVLSTRRRAPEPRYIILVKYGLAHGGTGWFWLLTTLYVAGALLFTALMMGRGLGAR